MSSSGSSSVSIFEVGARDGLQNEKIKVSRSDRAWFVESLSNAGIVDLEAGAFVRADKVPQMAESEELHDELIQKNLSANLWYLVPNQKGLERALSRGIKNVALFTAVTESFNQANIGMSVDQSFQEIEAMVITARAAGLKLRGYLSTVWGCPFEGRVLPSASLKVIERMLALNLDQVSIGDTIGVAAPNGVDAILKPLLANARDLGSDRKIAVHFHDTRGTALANALRAYERGIEVFDSSAGGLGGCPFAPGAAGNLATEDLIYLFKEMGVETGIDYRALCETSLGLARRMNRTVFSSKALQAYISSCTRSQKIVWDK
jgi:hydroxymethylglutaryl-CoA lyase